MNISRSGYYKWLKTRKILNRNEINRKDLGELVINIHKRKPSYGYHRIRKIILEETGCFVSDNLVHKVCKILKIKSKAKHYKYKKPGEESVRYENLIGYNWNTKRPFEKVVSDTTSFWFKKKKYDWTFYLDVFNNDSNIFGLEINDGLKSIVSTVYQTYDGKDLYIEEKVANFLYLIIRNHVFIDGNKRIAATLFIYFLNFYNLLVAITLEKDVLVDLVMNFLVDKKV